MREQRKFEQENNPHYLKGPSKPKVGGVRWTRCGVCRVLIQVMSQNDKD